MRGVAGRGACCNPAIEFRLLLRVRWTQSASDLVRSSLTPAMVNCGATGCWYTCSRSRQKFLRLLVSQTGEIISLENLRAAIWGDETFVDFERSLNVCIAQIRSRG